MIELVLADAWTDPSDLYVFARDTDSHCLGVARDWATNRQLDTSVSTTERLVELTIEKNGQLYVFWDSENTELHQLIKKALDAGIEVHDICSPGIRLAQTDPTNERQNKKMPATSKAKIYSRAELDAFLNQGDEGEAQLDSIARKLNLDPEAAKTWADVVKAILKAQGSSTPAAPPAAPPADEDDLEDETGSDEDEDEDEDDAAGGDEEFVPYTEDELKALAEGDGSAASKKKGMDKLKAICGDFDVEIPGDRPRALTLVKLILEAQAAALAAAGDAADDDLEAESSTGSDEDEDEEVEDEETPLDVDEIVAAFKEAVDESFGTVMDEKLVPVTESIEAIDAKLDTIIEAIKALSTVKSAPAGTLKALAPVSVADQVRASASKPAAAPARRLPPRR